MVRIVTNKGRIGPKEAQLHSLREARCKIDHDGPESLIPRSLCLNGCSDRKPRNEPLIDLSEKGNDAMKTNNSSAPAEAKPQKEVVVRTKTSKKQAKAKARTAVKTKSAAPAVRPGSKLELIVKMLRRDGGCTTKDVLKACDWPSVSMPQQAKAAGITLRKEKKDGVTRYYAA